MYHRWQIAGRKETPAPFWLANQRDGAGASFYGLGPRAEKHLTTYFRRLRSSFSSLASVLSKGTIVAQLVAFPKPDWQLAEYLLAMREAGFTELEPRCSKSNLRNGRLWRDVPGRKWYANRRGNFGAGSEVLLLHTLSS
jgi:hypothetical protein